MTDTIAILKPDKKNRRKHNERNIGMIVNSLQQVGASRSIVIDEDNNILAGNGTVEAAQLAGIERMRIVDADGEEIIAVRRTGLTDEQKRRLALYDNRTAEIAEWNLEQMLEDVNEGLTFDGMFGKAELDELLKDLRPAGDGDAEPQIDKAEELRVKWGVETGQLWKVGEHRLICGDCTDKAVVDKLMQGELCGACVTDSPYGINREGIENDDPEGLSKLFDGCLAVMPIADGVIINFQSPRLFPVWVDAIRKTGHKFERALWMHKINDVTNAWHQWMLNGEIIIISSVGKPEWGEVKAVQDCYVITHDVKIKIPHTSVKPLPVFQDIVEHTIDIVYDPFLGSGTTMVACENLKRKCRAIEISPGYVAVALQRMQDAFGIVPELIQNENRT